MWRNSKKYLIVITGHPASGKTTLAKRLRDEFHFPLIYKDEIKEILFDTIGWSDIDQSKKLGLASYELMYYTLETHLNQGYSVIIESNFDPVITNNRLLEMKVKYDYQLIQVYCIANPDTLLRRYVSRGKSGQRHPGHFGHERIEEYIQKLELVPEIKLDTDITIDYNTDNFTKFQENEIIARLSRLMN